MAGVRYSDECTAELLDFNITFGMAAGEVRMTRPVHFGVSFHTALKNQNMNVIAPAEITVIKNSTIMASSRSSPVHLSLPGTRLYSFDTRPPKPHIESS